ncbi:uncharacterized protein LOC115561921 [Drosophila navojoa]|uniref:uncharacterized protein LOC115561921 n=1 Tax=Drosophila navojoa TaxID=7232 RepID=UPI0011BF62A6|nr:uncharacterized protein LOC115561921 [Drosophila navojoa]
MDTRTIPFVDMLAVSKSLRVQRKPILKFVPPTGVSFVNYRSLGEVDYFYLDCQNYRDYYRDPFEKMRRPAKFCQYQGRCGARPDRTVEALSVPGSWVKERPPVVYSEKYNQRMNLSGKINIDAHFSPNSVTVFKR